MIQSVLGSGSTVWQHPDLKLAPEENSLCVFACAKLVDVRFEQGYLALVVVHVLYLRVEESCTCK